MDNNKNGNKKYIERATDILVDLIKESRKNLPSPEKESYNFKKDLNSVGKFDKAFRENSIQLINWIKKNRKPKS